MQALSKNSFGADRKPAALIPIRSATTSTAPVGISRGFTKPAGVVSLANRTQHLSILYDIYCLMLLKRLIRGISRLDFAYSPPLSVARTLDPIVTGASLRESRFPISMP